MRWIRAWVAAIALWLLVGIVVFLLVARQGFSVRSSPGRLESFVAVRLRDLAVPRPAKKLQNPFANDARVLEEGADHFAVHCAICHGPDGRGRNYLARHLDPPSPDLTQPRTQRLSDGALYYIIMNGVRWTGMPAWKDEHSPEETWHLVTYIRYLAASAQKPAEEPPGPDSTESHQEHDHAH